MQKGIDCHVRLSFVQAEFVRESAEKLGVSPSNFVKFLIATEIERKKWTPKVTVNH